MAQNVKNQMSEMMKQAWLMVKRYGMTMSEAMRKAWSILKLRKAMKASIVKFYFTKVDGSIREAWGTLMDNVMPRTTDGGSKRKSSEMVVPYYDTEKQDFRCFKIANFLRMA